jgi:TonB family protein
MFASLPSGAWYRRHKLEVGSLVLHGLLLAWLLHPPEPQRLNPSFAAQGHYGNSVMRIYWPTSSPDDSAGSSAASASEGYKHQRLGHQKLIWKRTTELAKLSPPIPSRAGAEDDAKTVTLPSQGHGAPAGLPYGTLTRGPAFGEEVRPALPVATVDPVTYPWEMPDSEGNVVVEITIDERGEITRKTVLQSMGPKLDDKVLAALENWRFQPATRNGIPIASKQDAVFHFRPRG